MFESNYKVIIALLCVLLFVACTEKVGKENEYALSSNDCKACERLTLFYKAKSLVGKSIWNGLNDTTLITPLFYFTDSTTYLAFSNEGLFNQTEYVLVDCKSGIEVQKLHQRLDHQAFHMENKMSFKDTSSLYYYRPMMLCSDVETMHQFVPDFATTEEWLQLVMHEYFHSFQFSHVKTINYLADTIRIAADTLDHIFLSNEWFQQIVKQENHLLKMAFETKNEDSLNWYINEFHIQRENRRSTYQDTSGFDLVKAENFWETIEGTARYVEYYMATHFADISVNDPLECDNLFHNFEKYAHSEYLENQEEFKQRTAIMPAYYYVTGFNLCRLMDKLGYKYKSELFDQRHKGLYEIFLNAHG